MMHCTKRFTTKCLTLRLSAHAAHVSTPCHVPSASLCSCPAQAKLTINPMSLRSQITISAAWPAFQKRVVLTTSSSWGTLGRVLLDYHSFSPVFSASVFHERTQYLYCIHNTFTKTSKLLRKEILQNILGINEMNKTINASLNFNEDEKFRGTLHGL